MFATNASKDEMGSPMVDIVDKLHAFTSTRQATSWKAKRSCTKALSMDGFTVDAILASLCFLQQDPGGTEQQHWRLLKLALELLAPKMRLRGAAKRTAFPILQLRR